MDKDQFELIQDNHILTLRLKAEYDYSLKIPLNIPDNFEFKDPIAVIIHIFYTDLIGELLSYIENIPAHTDLYISTDSDEKKIRIERQLKNYNKGTVVIRVFSNRGRDIAPCFIGFRDIFDQYQYCLHIHTKKSAYNPRLGQWRGYLLDSLIGSVEIATSNLYLLAQDDIGVIFPQHFADIRDNIEWGNNFQNTKWLLGLAGIEINQTTLLEFPSSSMLFAKTAALKKLYSLPVLWDDFEKERGQIDGTLAHAYERSFLYFCESSGYKWIKVNQSETNKQFVFNSLDPLAMSHKIEQVYPRVSDNYYEVFAQLQTEWMLNNNSLPKKIKRNFSFVKRLIKKLFLN
jgi:lipopolysaccharide biosynthesis protein